MAKLPYFPFYVGDWMKDPELRLCSIFARGLLVDLLCLMWEAKHRGRLSRADGSSPWTDSEIVGAISGSTEAEKLIGLSELEANGVLKRDDKGVLFSSRMVRDEEIKIKRAVAGSKGGSKTSSKRAANQVANVVAKSQQNTEYENEVATDTEAECLPCKEEEPVDWMTEQADFLAIFNATDGTSKASAMSHLHQREFEARTSDPWWRDNWRTALGKFPTVFHATESRKVGLKAFLEAGFVEAVVEGKYDKAITKSNGKSSAVAEHQSAAQFDPNKQTDHTF